MIDSAMKQALHTLVLASALFCSITLNASENWPQLQGNAARSGDAFDVSFDGSFGLVASVPLTDGVYASPVVQDGSVYLIDGSGVVFAVDAETHEVVWKLKTKGGPGNCNNVAAPAVVGDYLHVGTTAGYYYVLNRHDGAIVKVIDCKEPIFSAPVVGINRVYFATLGAQVYAIEADGNICWKWDFVKEVIQFSGDRWSGEDWLAFRKQRVTWRDHFVCSRDICLLGETIVIPAGGRTLFLDDMGDAPKLRTIGLIPKLAGSEYPATLGQSADGAGNLYVQWHRRDNVGRVEIMRLDGNEVVTSFIAGSDTSIRKHGLLGFASVSVRGNRLYRVRPEQGAGLCLHELESGNTIRMNAAAAISPPVITRSHIIYGGLDGKLHLVQHDSVEGDKATSYATAFGSAISAPVAAANDKIFAGCEDGYLYIFGKNGRAELPKKELQIARIRSPLTGLLADEKYSWYTNYGNFSGTNSNDQGLKPPLRMRWARRLAGTVKHLPVCGGGRLYIHTAEGQVLALEQDTGRLLWRRHWPDVYLSFTSPLYINGKLLVPQAGIKRSMMRCLDAATGKLLWETPFTGSPSWSRQFPPVVQGNVAIYASGSGRYAAQGSFTFGRKPLKPGEPEITSWIYSNDNPFYPKDHEPRIWAWDLDSGKLVWEKNFSKYGQGGNDCGICLYNGKFYYSTFFGYANEKKRRRGLPSQYNGLTACLDPQTGEILWLTTDYFVTSKCTLSARNGRLYIGGNNRASQEVQDRFVWCLNASDGSLIWKSDAITSALNVVSVGERFIFSNALRGKGNIFDQQTGRVTSGIETNYACCRFTLSEPYVLGANMDMIDLSDNGKLVSTGPAIDSRECLGAVVSNGRIFYISQASGFVVSQTYGPESKNLPAVWQRTD